MNPTQYCERVISYLIIGSHGRRTPQPHPNPVQFFNLNPQHARGTAEAAALRRSVHGGHSASGDSVPTNFGELGTSLGDRFTVPNLAPGSAAPDVNATDIQTGGGHKKARRTSRRTSPSASCRP
jgi:hypothetical protein